MTTVLSPMVLVDPTVTTVGASAAMAPRPESLDGLVIGLLNNGKRNADLVLDATHRMLRERYKLAGVVQHAKGSASQPFARDIIDDVAKRCQVVITAVGD